jgi:superfamily II DNA/RNA helicase
VQCRVPHTVATHPRRCLFCWVLGGEERETISCSAFIARMQVACPGCLTRVVVSAQIFCETKRGCDLLTRQLRTDGWPALSIHGDKSQQERDWVLAVSRRRARAIICSSQHTNLRGVC